MASFTRGPGLAKTIDWRLRPTTERFGDRRLGDIETADVEDRWHAVGGAEAQRPELAARGS